MANPNFQRRSSVLPDVKVGRKKAFEPYKDLSKYLKAGSDSKLRENLMVRGHIVPGCSQVHSKSSDSEKLSEDDLTKKRNSKLRTMKLQPINERSMLMEKFESSLKERLLSSTSFSKQVPLFDSLSNKEKIRTKVPLLDDDLSKNESMFNAVFPARKDSARCISPHVNEELFSKHNRESQDWLKEIENEVKKSKTRSKDFNEGKDEENLKKITSLSKKIKGSSESKLKPVRNVQNELNNGSLEQIKFLSSPRLSSRVGERGSSKSKMAKDKYSSLELNAGDSRKMILPKLSSKKNSTEASKCVIMENQQVMESDLNKEKILASSLDLNLKLKTNEMSGTRSQKTTNLVRESFEKDLSGKDNLSKNSTSGLNNSVNMEITYIEKDISEKESVEIYGLEGVRGKVNAKIISKDSINADSQSTCLNTNKSSSLISERLRRGGQMGVEGSLIHYDEYDVLYFETQKDSDPKLEDGQSQDTVSTVDGSTIVAETETAAEVNTAESVVTLADPQPIDPSLMKYEDMEEEELLKEMKGEEEEDCTAEPCNEPTWFEEYGIDKKSRKGMEDDAKSDESDEEELGEPAVIEEVDVVQEVVQEDEDVLEAKKKKVKKARMSEVKGVEEVQEITEEIKEFESEIVRQIITVPLVTLDQIPEKERPVVEKPLSQMPMEYLKKYVGKHLVAGLAQVALYMPNDPVEYLAHWLIRERNKENLLEEFKEFKAEVREIRKKNIDDMRRKLQKEYLHNEALKRYQDGKYEPLYPSFDSSESETEMRSMDEGKLREEQTTGVTEQEESDNA